MSNQALSNPSQLVIRNGEWLQCNRMLILGMPADDLCRELLAEGVAAEIYGFTRDFSVYRAINDAWSEQKQSLEFGSALTTEASEFDGVLIFLQKSKPLMDFWLDMALPVLSANGTVWLVGENNEGIKSWRKRLKSSFNQVKNMDNARHCSLLEASEPMSVDKPFTMDSYYATYNLSLAGKNLTLTSLPGVFSHGRVDVGTEVLLETFDSIPAGRILDFGCGAGVVAGFLGKLQPEASLLLVDCDALALTSSEKTLALNGIQDYAVVASDGLSEVSGSFQMIVSNPPFHQGVKTHYAVTEQFLEASAKLLQKGGELRIVANSFLRYEPIIKKALGNCKSLVVKNGFTVYQAYKR